MHLGRVAVGFIKHSITLGRSALRGTWCFWNLEEQNMAWSGDRWSPKLAFVSWLFPSCFVWGKFCFVFLFFPSFSFFLFFLRVGRVFSLMIHSMKASSSVEAHALLHSPFCWRQMKPVMFFFRLIPLIQTHWPSPSNLQSQHSWIWMCAGCWFHVAARQVLNLTITGLLSCWAHVLHERCVRVDGTWEQSSIAECCDTSWRHLLHARQRQLQFAWTRATCSWTDFCKSFGDGLAL